MKCVLVKIVLITLVAIPVLAKTPRVILCNDEAGGPPFAMRVQGEMVGLSLELAKYIFKGSQFDYELQWKPFSRCLVEVEKGDSDIIMDMYYSKEREKFADYSLPYYQLNSSLYFLTVNAEKAKKIRSFSEMKQMRVCGRRDFDYSHFQLNESDFVVLGNSYEQIVEMLKRDRCDFFPEESEIMDGMIASGDLKIKPSAFFVVSADWVKGPDMHWGISKKSKYKEALLSHVNKRIAELKKNPALLKKWKDQFSPAAAAK